MSKYHIHKDFKFLKAALPFDKLSIKIAQKIIPLFVMKKSALRDVDRRKKYVYGKKGLKIPVEIFEPTGSSKALPCLLYIHGGGFAYPALNHHIKFACHYAKEANCRVIFPDYRLLPKNVFPTAYEDILTVYKWICENADNLSIDKTKIAIGGDSAGGALAINLSNTVESAGLISPCFQMLIYPVTDKNMTSPSMKSYCDTPIWHSTNTRKMWQMYLKNAPKDSLNLASPMDNPLPANLPPTYVEVAEFDCLRDEGLLYAQKLEKAGIDVDINLTKGTPHGYDIVFKSKITQDSLAKRVLALRKGFSLF